LRSTLATLVAAGTLAGLTSAASAPAASDAGGAGGAASCANADRVPSAATEAQARTSLLCLLDAARKEHKVDPLHDDLHVRRAAQSFADWLGPAKPLTHVGRGGTSPAGRLATAGYEHGKRNAFDAGEAIGRSIGTSATPAARMAAWMADARTRKILMASRFRDGGVGVSAAGDKVTFVVDLGAPHGR
jgi:uncharacterized protein YkwD